MGAVQLDSSPELLRRARLVNGLLERVERLGLHTGSGWVVVRFLALRDIQLGAEAVTNERQIPKPVFVTESELDDLLARGRQLQTGLGPLSKRLQDQLSPFPSLSRAGSTYRGSGSGC